MKLTDTRQHINELLAERRAAGLCGQWANFRPELCRDRQRGLFLRVTIELVDGSEISIDTFEANTLLEQCLTSGAISPH